MITYLAPLPIGNAVRCLFEPPPGAEQWQVLRRSSLPFIGVDDPDAAVVYSGTDTNFVDTATLTNGTLVYYLDYAFVGDAWVAGGTAASVVPVANGIMAGADPQEFIRGRLEAGLQVEVASNALKHVDGAVPTLSAPPIFDETQFPIVTVHLEGFSQAAHGLGEIIAPDVFDEVGGEWLDSEGFLARVQLKIVGWVVGNPDTRITLRKAINKILLGNLPVFADQGFITPEWSATDAEDFDSYSAPMYMTIFTFSCIAPVAISALTAPISDVTVTATAAPENDDEIYVIAA